MSTMTLSVQDGVNLLTLTNGENVNGLTLDVVNEYHQNLDQVEATEGNTAFVLYSDDPKTFCNGINLEWLMSCDADTVTKFVTRLEDLFLRVALLNMPTIACLNGNTYAGGAILATAFDYRTMREDRGRFCYPEVNIKIPFTEVMFDIIDLNANKKALKDMALMGTAYTGAECKDLDVVDSLYSMEELLPKTLEFASELAQKDRATFAAIKRGMRKALMAHWQARQS